MFLKQFASPTPEYLNGTDQERLGRSPASQVCHIEYDVALGATSLFGARQIGLVIEGRS